MYSVPVDEHSSNDSSRTSIIICGIILCPLTLALTVLFGWHIYLILQNKTTIEYHEGVRAMWLAEKGGNLYHHPYHLGVYENLISVRTILFVAICIFFQSINILHILIEGNKGTTEYLTFEKQCRRLSPFPLYKTSKLLPLPIHPVETERKQNMRMSIH
jgi:hypothetical protein